MCVSQSGNVDMYIVYCVHRICICSSCYVCKYICTYFVLVLYILLLLPLEYSVHMGEFVSTVLRSSFAYVLIYVLPVNCLKLDISTLSLKTMKMILNYIPNNANGILFHSVIDILILYIP